MGLVIKDGATGFTAIVNKEGHLLVDAVIRLLPGALGDDESSKDESFTEGLLEYPQYTRPEVFREMKVPEVLLSGDHGRIAAWRRRQGLERTKKWRPDLLGDAPDEQAG